VIKRTVRYFVLVLTLLAFNSTLQKASAQSGCTDPSCVVGGTDPEPMGEFRMYSTVLATVLLP
jgi:hypothetical protein